MATISKTILPIPESVVVGSGSYTVPANKYGFLSGSVATAGGISAVQSSGSYPNNNTTSASASNVRQWLTAGSSVTTASSAPASSTTTPGVVSISVSAEISVDGTVVASSRGRLYSCCTNSAYPVQWASDAKVGWIISIFPIPVNNLPDSLIT